MNVSNIIDIDAFSSGLSSSIKDTGLIIPIAAVCMITNMLKPMAAGVPYGSELIDAYSTIWKVHIIGNRSGG